MVLVTNLDFLNLVTGTNREVQRLFLVGNLLSDDILGFAKTLTTIFSGSKLLPRPFFRATARIFQHGHTVPFS